MSHLFRICRFLVNNTERRSPCCSYSQILKSSRSFSLLALVSVLTVRDACKFTAVRAMARARSAPVSGSMAAAGATATKRKTPKGPKGRRHLTTDTTNKREQKQQAKQTRTRPEVWTKRPRAIQAELRRVSPAKVRRAIKAELASTRKVVSGAFQAELASARTVVSGAFQAEQLRWQLEAPVSRGKLKRIVSRIHPAAKRAKRWK